MNRSIISKYLKDYKFNSVFAKNLVMLMLMVAVPLTVLVVGAFVYHNNTLKAEALSYYSTVMLRTENSFEKIFVNAIEQIDYMKLNKNIQLYMYEDSIYDENKYYSYSALIELVNMQTNTQADLENIYVYAVNSDSVLSEAGINPLEVFHKRDYIIEGLDRVKGEKASNIHINSNNKTISIQTPIYYGVKFMGFVSVDIKIKSLRAAAMDNSEHLFVLWNNRVLYDKNESFLDVDVDQVTELKPYLDHKKESTFIDKDLIVAIEKSDVTQFTFVASSQIQQYANRTAKLRFFLTITVITIFIATIIICYIVSVKIFTPFDQIIKAFKPDDLVKTNGNNNEIKYIVNTINQSNLKKEEAAKELESRINLLKKAQSVALQAQINPHFLYNILETINMLAMNLLGGKNEVSKTIKVLSKMLRLSLENTDSIISLREEIEHCKAYLTIQTIRYEDKFKVIWEIPEALLDAGIVQITLQPIVENAIYHGIKPSPQNGEILITGSLCEDGIEIKVKNTGVPLSKEVLSQINETMKSEMIKESEHIGLSNVNQRLKLFFGNQYGLSLESDHMSYTTATIKIPRIQL
ncbi:MAG: sensor histidine kinase [Vallitaleaceae bacterium]|nr:sensor histidine kinase [Vallitaleaceae bacterium]